MNASLWIAQRRTMGRIWKCSPEFLESFLSDMAGFVIRRCESEGVVQEKGEGSEKPISRLLYILITQVVLRNSAAVWLSVILSVNQGF